jgi:hypothetical protein
LGFTLSVHALDIPGVKGDGNIVYLHNQGTIDALYLNGISLQGSEGKTAELLKNEGKIGAITETTIHNQGGK